MSKNMIIIGIISVNFMAEQMYWIVLDCTGVPNEVATECMYCI